MRIQCQQMIMQCLILRAKDGLIQEQKKREKQHFRKQNTFPYNDLL